MGVEHLVDRIPLKRPGEARDLDGGWVDLDGGDESVGGEGGLGGFLADRWRGFVSGLQPLRSPLTATWASGPGWYMTGLWPLTRAR
jgi:hypothetical protein